MEALVSAFMLTLLYFKSTEPAVASLCKGGQCSHDDNATLQYSAAAIMKSLEVPTVALISSCLLQHVQSLSKSLAFVMADTAGKHGGIGQCFHAGTATV